MSRKEKAQGASHALWAFGKSDLVTARQLTTGKSQTAKFFSAVFFDQPTNERGR
jgi:hypothetical protein